MNKIWVLKWTIVQPILSTNMLCNLFISFDFKTNLKFYFEWTGACINAVSSIEIAYFIYNYSFVKTRNLEYFMGINYDWLLKNLRLYLYDFDKEE